MSVRLPRLRPVLSAVSPAPASALVLILFLFLMPGCSAPSPPPDSATWSLYSAQQRVEGRLQVRYLLRDLETAESSGNLAALAALYDREARWLPPGGPVVEGRVEILKRYQAMFAEADIRVVLTDQSVAIAGGKGQVLGWVGQTRTPRAGGAVEQQIYRFRLVADRNDELVWHISFLQWWDWEDLDIGPEELPEGVLPSPEWGLDPLDESSTDWPGESTDETTDGSRVESTGG